MIVLAAGWGALASLPVVSFARRRTALAHARALGEGGRSRPRRVRRPLPSWCHGIVAVVSMPARRRATKRREDAMLRDLPVAIDLLAVAIGAGCTPYDAIEVAAAWCPPSLRGALERVPRTCRLGEPFDDALRATARATPVLAPVADALRSANRLGAPVGPTLARLSDETRAMLRRAAETRARTVPVRLLFPLVFLVLPAFGLLTVAPVLLDGLATR